MTPADKKYIPEIRDYLKDSARGLIPKWEDSPTDTPETDAAADNAPHIEAACECYRNHARTLERARDAAQKTASVLCWNLGKCGGIAKGILKPYEFAPEGIEPPYPVLQAAEAVSKVVQERDAAIKDFADMKTHHEHEMMRACENKDRLTAERDAALRELTELTATHERYAAVFLRIAEAIGITSPLQLIAQAENNEQNYAEILAGIIERMNRQAIDAAKEAQ